MSDTNAFSRILARLEEADNAVTEKTASAAPAEKTADVKLIEQVRKVSEAAVKTASPAPATSTPASDLKVMAKEAADAENAMLVKQAQFMGAAIADGFMARFAQYDTALSTIGVKTAGVTQEDLTKVAEGAYRKGAADVEKLAEAEFEKGYNDTMEFVHKTASELHLAGQSMAHDVVERLSK